VSYVSRVMTFWTDRIMHPVPKRYHKLKPTGAALRHIRGHGRDSGVTIDSRAGWIAEFRGGLIARFHTYADRDEALEAAGLSE